MYKIKFGVDSFVYPTKEINQAVHNYFFIDNFDLESGLLDPKMKVWCRYDDEYQKSLKNK